MNNAVLLAEEAAESSVNMPFPVEAYGIFVLVVLLALVVIVTRFDPDR